MARRWATAISVCLIHSFIHSVILPRARDAYIYYYYYYVYFAAFFSLFICRCCCRYSSSGQNCLFTHTFFLSLSVAALLRRDLFLLLHLSFRVSFHRFRVNNVIYNGYEYVLYAFIAHSGLLHTNFYI